MNGNRALQSDQKWRMFAKKCYTHFGYFPAYLQMFWAIFRQIAEVWAIFLSKNSAFGIFLGTFWLLLETLSGSSALRSRL